MINKEILKKSKNVYKINQLKSEDEKTKTIFFTMTTAQWVIKGRCYNN